MKHRKLKLEIKWDNGVTSGFGTVDFETYKIIETIVSEVSMGNALALWVNGGMALSVPEKHSGEYRHVADITADRPLVTKRGND